MLIARTRVALAVLGCLLAACHNPVDAGDSRACQQTYEFSNSGCAEVAGQIVGSRSQSLSGIAVTMRQLSGPSLFTTPAQWTDAEGRFRLRFARMVGEPPATAAADTVSVYVIAADPKSAGVGVPATVRDSVLAIVTVTPIGAVPAAAQVRIVLPVE